MTSTHREDQPILEVGEGLVALVTVIFSGVGVLCHHLITVCIRASLVETVLSDLTKEMDVLQLK